MDEMTQLREFRSSVPAPAVTPEAEEAFTDRIRAETAHPTAARRGGTARRLNQLSGRYHWRFAVAAAMSVALAVGLIAAVGHNTGRPGPVTAQPGPVGGPITAVLLAEMAAARAAAQPPVSPHQWVYTKIVLQRITPAGLAYSCRVRNANGETHDVAIPMVGVEFSPPPGTPCSVWSNGAVKGRNFEMGPTSPGNSHGHVTGRGTIVATTVRAATHRTKQEAWSTADSLRQASYSATGKLVVSAACSCGLIGYSNLAKVPTDPKALVRWAMKTPGGGGHYTTADLAWNAFNGIEGTLMDIVLPPKLAAELYRALADIPGVTVNKKAVDPAGRQGLAFVLSDLDHTGSGGTGEIFIDPHTYQLTGYADQYSAQCQCPSPGTTSGTAILRQALVSGPGVRP
jgi:hypothetical protein